MDSSSAAVGPPWRPVAPDIEPTDLRVDEPHPARVYDYFLGGKDNFPADRAAAGQATVDGLDLPAAIRQNRAFMHRAVRFLTAEAGIRQFLDVGTGIPTSPNLHEIAQKIAPETRVVYVDNDPIVLAHARALLTSTPEGRTTYLDADLRDPARILTAPELAATLDFTRPVTLSLLAILHFVPDDAEAHRVVDELVAALPSGSYLALTHATGDFHPYAATSAARYRATGVPFQLRPRDEVATFFHGLELVEPGITAVHTWRPDDPIEATAVFCGGIARKP